MIIHTMVVLQDFNQGNDYIVQDAVRAIDFPSTVLREVSKIRS